MTVFTISEELDFLVRFYRGYIFLEWLDRCYNTTFNHGSDLVLALGSARNGKPGMPDNVYAAERFLRAAEKGGVIKKSQDFPTPSHDQRFFNVQAAGVAKKFERQLRQETEYGWTVTEKTKPALELIRNLIDNPT